MFMYKQRIKRLTIPPKEIFELTLTLHIRKTFIILFHFWSCFKLKSAETHRARWAQKQNNSQKIVTSFGTERAMMIIFFWRSNFRWWRVFDPKHVSWKCFLFEIRIFFKFSTTKFKRVVTTEVEELAVFRGIFEFQLAVENFPGVVTPWCGYLKWFSGVELYVE